MPNTPTTDQVHDVVGSRRRGRPPGVGDSEKRKQRPGRTNFAAKASTAPNGTSQVALRNADLATLERWAKAEGVSIAALVSKIVIERTIL